MTGVSPVAAIVPTNPLAIARPLSWLVVASFLAAAVLETRDRERARTLAVSAWALFGVFWLVLIPHFVFEIGSIVEGLGSVAAVPMSFYAGYLLWNGRDSLFVLSRAVGLMGIIYLPFVYVPLLDTIPLRQWLVETVTDQTAFVMSLVGVDSTIVDGMSFTINESIASDHPYPADTYNISDATKKYPDESTFVFPHNAKPITYTIVTACTGIGSMSIITGGVLAVSAPLRRKLRALAVSLPVIYALNLLRNAFIAIMFGHQRMQVFVGPVTSLFGLTDEQLVSYYVADRLLAQFGSVVAMVFITWLVVRELPEIVTIVEDLLYLLTGNEYDLQDAFGADVAANDAD